VVTATENGRFPEPSPSLDTGQAVFYNRSMDRFLSLLISALLIFAGFGSVPRCYVMQPDCAVRGAFQCLPVHTKGVANEKGCTGCPHMAKQSTRQQETTPDLPTDRMARFLIDQDRHNPDLFPDCVPTLALVQNSWLSLDHPLNDREIFPIKSVHLPEPPLLILLQKQSFLI
jgi:hypothetical protein